MFSEKGRVPVQASRKREVPWSECDRLQLGSWLPRERKAASSYRASQMGQEGSGTRAVCLEAGMVGGTVGPFEVPLPNHNAPDYSYWTKTTRNYLTLGGSFYTTGRQGCSSRRLLEKVDKLDPAVVADSEMAWENLVP